MKIKDYVFNENDVKNVGTAERALSFVAGVWLFSKAFSGRNKLFKALLGGALVYRAGKGYCPLYKALDVDGTSSHNRVLVDTDIIVNKPREEVYAYWRNLENLPIFMKHLESVRELSELHSVWTARIPGGLGNLEWKCEISSDVPNESIKWKSTPDSQVDNTGLVRFVDAGELGTRQIFSGIRGSYAEPEKLVGRSVVFIANLAPRKMRFGLSEGMILSAGLDGGSLHLLDADSGVQPGMPVR